MEKLGWKFSRVRKGSAVEMERISLQFHTREWGKKEKQGEEESERESESVIPFILHLSDAATCCTTSTRETSATNSRIVIVIIFYPFRLILASLCWFTFSSFFFLWYLNEVCSIDRMMNWLFSLESYDLLFASFSLQLFNELHSCLKWKGEGTDDTRSREAK